MSKTLIPLMKPQLPTAQMLFPLLEEIDRNRTYSNFGPFVTRFQERLASHFHSPAGSVVTVANGTLGLLLALQTLGVRTGQFCLMPSWTFTATAAAAVTAGLIPYFIDVDPQTWSLDPQKVRHILLHSGLPIGAVLVVAPFGSPLEGSRWDALTEETGVPVLIDAAAGFDSLHITKTPVMVSFHATKAFGIGEGGMVASTDLDFIERLRQRSVFGFYQTRQSQVSGLNGKISEVSAAIGLAMLDLWPHIRGKLKEVAQLYRSTLERTLPEKLLFPVGWGHHWISATCNILLKAGNSQSMIKSLQKAGIESRRWWDQPLHLHKAYKIMPREELPITEALAQQIIGLPFYSDLDPLSLHHVAEEVARYVSPLPVAAAPMSLLAPAPQARKRRPPSKSPRFVKQKSQASLSRPPVH
jgi:dTDP-4-amino-4,6-dideoxygalactose transaminase